MLHEAIRCYKAGTYDELNKQVVKACKGINQECLIPTHVPMPLIAHVHNFARVEDISYKDADEYTHTENLMKVLIALMLIDPLPI